MADEKRVELTSCVIILETQIIRKKRNASSPSTFATTQVFSFQDSFPSRILGSSIKRLLVVSQPGPRPIISFRLSRLSAARPNVISTRHLRWPWIDETWGGERGSLEGGKAFQLIRVRVRTRANNSSKGGRILVGNIGEGLAKRVRAIRNNGQGCRHGGVEASGQRRCNFVNRE